ncbi:copper homeostasis membrane protein CopD [Phenylobacterium sp. VNQ135]|uniref:copper homeostasis membrane protein CopD n=1 Tax=Phenylobacterium sp. VNQ135 TaxID=3400922 RepID=UPI003BFC73D0
MLEPAVIVLRLAQYLGAMVLMGSSLFFVYALPGRGDGSAAEAPWTRRLLAAAGALLAVTALFAVIGQASVLSGSLTEGLKPETLTAVVTGMDLGKAAIARAVAAALAVILVLSLKPSRTTWMAVAALGALATGSLAWMGHGAATEGGGSSVHLISDILHAWAAAVWIGALVAFLLLLRTPTPTPAATVALHRALHGFSGVGTGLVAVLLATGVINGWFLVGPDHLSGLWTTPYGRLLSLKLVLFVAMLGLAAANRFQLTPALGLGLGAQDSEGAALDHLRRSVILETALGFGVLALVAWFGTLAPPAAM